MPDLPFLIIGQGLAGTAFAWECWQRSVPFTIVDRDEEVTSSKLAAGLITPIAGFRVAQPGDYDEHFAAAQHRYRDVEQRLSIRVLHDTPHLRFLASEVEVDHWQRKNTQLRHWRPTTFDPALFDNHHGAFEMTQSGWLDTAAYLAASKAFFQKHGCWQQGEVHERDLVCEAERVRWQDHTYRAAVQCIGWEAARSEWFEWVKFQSIRGTILEGVADLGSEQRIVHGGFWLLPLGDGRVRIGATYERALDGRDSEAALADLHERIQRVLRVPYEVRSQRAAVRPAIRGQFTFIGTHPARSRIAFFNGLASKGVLRAPHYARLLIEHLLEGTALPIACDVRANH